MAWLVIYPADCAAVVDLQERSFVEALAALLTSTEASSAQGKIHVLFLLYSFFPLLSIPF